MSNGITETIGLDLGDRYTRYSVLDQRSGEEVRYRAWFLPSTSGSSPSA